MTISCKHRILPFALLAATGLAVMSTIVFAEDPSPTGPEAIDRLITALGDDNFRAREDAQAKLIAIGPSVIPKVQAVADSEDPEVRQRAKLILEELEKQARAERREHLIRNLLWEFSLGDGLVSAPQIAGGRILLIGRDDRLHALDAKTGKDFWSVPCQAETFALDAGSVYFRNGEGELQALDLDSGKALPDFTPVAISTNPTPADGVIYAGAGENELWALDAKTGAKKWGGTFPQPIAYAPAVGDGRVYVVGHDENIYALQAETGKQLWTFHVENPKAHSIHTKAMPFGLTPAAGQLYFRTHTDIGALNGQTGEKLWIESLVDQNQDSLRMRLMEIMIQQQMGEGNQAVPGGGQAMPLVDGVLYCRSGDILQAFDAQTGKKKWRFLSKKSESEKDSAEERIRQFQVELQQIENQQDGVRKILMRNGQVLAEDRGVPAIRNGVMYFTSSQGLHAVDLKTQKELWMLEQKGLLAAQPLIVQGADGTGVVYFGSAKGLLSQQIVSGAVGGARAKFQVRIVAGGGNVAVQPVPAQPQAEDKDEQPQEAARYGLSALRLPVGAKSAEAPAGK